MKNTIYSSILIVFIFILGIFFLVKDSEYIGVIKYVKIGEANIKVELALDKERQESGLSGRESLDEGTGMLFVFPISGRYYFWMKAMNFSIDMIWINEKKEIIYIKHNAEPEEFLETYGPEQDSKYVLEVNAGVAEKLNWKIGDIVEFTHTPIF